MQAGSRSLLFPSQQPRITKVDQRWDMGGIIMISWDDDGPDLVFSPNDQVSLFRNVPLIDHQESPFAYQLGVGDTIPEIPGRELYGRPRVTRIDSHAPKRIARCSVYLMDFGGGMRRVDADVAAVFTGDIVTKIYNRPGLVQPEPNILYRHVTTRAIFKFLRHPHGRGRWSASIPKYDPDTQNVPDRMYLVRMTRSMDLHLEIMKFDAIVLGDEERTLP